jgi:hypothetical protein
LSHQILLEFSTSLDINLCRFFGSVLENPQKSTFLSYLTAKITSPKFHLPKATADEAKTVVAASETNVMVLYYFI